MPIGKFSIGMMSQFVMRNPFTAAEAIFAPFFAKSEDRGYFRTAIITTPIVFATGAFVPKLFGGVRDLGSVAMEAKNLLQKSEKYTRFEQPNYNDLTTLFKDTSATSDIINRNLSAYLVTERRASRDFLKEQKVLTKLFNRRFLVTADLIGKSDMGDLKAIQRIKEIDDKSYLVTKALKSSRKASLTPGEWAREIQPTWEGPTAKAMTNEEMVSMFDEYSSRPEFVKSLKNRLREIRHQTYKGTLDIADGPPGTAGVPFPIEFDEVDDSARAAFAKQAPEAYQNLEQAYKGGHVRDVSILAEDVVDGKVGRVLSIKVSRSEKGHLKDLTIPVMDPATGTVRLGPNAIGVGDYVIDPFQKEHRLDSWITKMLVERRDIPIHERYPGEPSLESEIAAHAYWHAGDPMDVRRMAELEASEGSAGQFTEEARKLRSQAAKYTKLPVFTNKKEELVTYRNLNVREQEDVVRRTLNTNRYINMSGEAGTYEGRFVRREAAFLSPYGAPSAEKQDAIWRAATKEFQLRAPEGLSRDARLGWRSTSWETLTGSSGLSAAKVTTASIDPQTRTALIAELRGSGRDNLAASFGRMGETGGIMKESFATGLTVEGISKYNVTELGVKVGDTVDSDLVMGFRDDERVVPKHLGTVTDISRDETGYVINVRHELGMQGAKFDISGVKGMIAGVPSNDHFEQMRQAANEYARRTGSGDFIPESVNMLMPAEYFANKVEPAHAQLSIGSDLVSRLEDVGGGDVTSKYRARMASELATTWQDGQFVIDAAKLGSASDIDAATRLRKLTEITEELFKDAGIAVREAGGYSDPVLTAYVHSGKELGDWMLKNQLPGMMFTWDHSLVNAPRFASFTHDIATHLMLGNNFAGLKAIQSRLVTSSGGDPRQSLDFMKYVMGGDFSKEMGITIPLNQAFKGNKGSLNLAKNRSESIFDSSVATYKENFRIDLGNGQFLPVPGTDAYMAEAKQFAPGEYQTRPWQHTLQDLAYETDATKKAELQVTLLERYKEQFGVEKGSALRPYQQDPGSIAGVFSTIAEEENPFTARISRQLAEKVRSKRLRDALLRGEEVMGALHRQPTNQMLYMKFKIDDAMTNTLDIGVAERISRSFIGDQDKDTAYALLFDANVRVENGKMIVAGKANKLEAEAATEAYEAIHSGRQLENLEAWEGVKGTPEVANRVTGFEMKNLADRAEAFAGRVRNRVGVAINRMAGAQIGPYSNLLTGITEHMARNPDILRDPKLGARLNAIMFDIRQAPISARKAPSFSLEQAAIHLDQLKKAVAEPNYETAAEKLHAGLVNLGKTLNPEFSGTSEYKYLAEQGLEDFKVWAKGRTEKADIMTRAFTASVDQSKPFAGQAAEKNLPRIFEDVESVLGAHHGGRMAQESASKAGMLADFLGAKGSAAAEAATGKMGKIFAKHGGAMALGLGSLAALGIAMTSRKTPVASFSRSSGNSFRPEQRMGVSDNIPGEPVSGSMAPSAPPRRTEIPQPGVRTTVVAPMGRTSDLSVRMKATDQSRAAETSRLISRVQDGNTNVTINYRDRTKIGSLRTREKIRELR